MLCSVLFHPLVLGLARVSLFRLIHLFRYLTLPYEFPARPSTCANRSTEHDMLRATRNDLDEIRLPAAEYRDSTRIHWWATVYYVGRQGARGRRLVVRTIYTLLASLLRGRHVYTIDTDGLVRK